jgi:hypothetical protein
MGITLMNNSNSIISGIVLADVMDDILKEYGCKNKEVVRI